MVYLPVQIGMCHNIYDMENFHRVIYHLAIRNLMLPIIKIMFLTSSNTLCHYARASQIYPREGALEVREDFQG